MKRKKTCSNSNLLKIGISLDDTITASLESLSFFILLTESLKERAEIYIITDRDKTQASFNKTVEELESLGIYYDVLLLTSDKKGEVIRNEITVFFDDTDDYILQFPKDVAVFKIREDGNFNFRKQKWVGTKETVEIV